MLCQTISNILELRREGALKREGLHPEIYDFLEFFKASDFTAGPVCEKMVGDRSQIYEEGGWQTHFTGCLFAYLRIHMDQSRARQCSYHLVIDKREGEESSPRVDSTFSSMGTQPH